MGEDIGEHLGYAKPRNAVGDHVPTKCIKKVLDFSGPETMLLKLKQGNNNNTGSMSMINKIGVYYLVGASRTEKGKQFRCWVYETLLPQLEKYGAYILQTQINLQTAVIAAKDDKIDEIKKLIQQSETASNQQLKAIEKLTNEARQSTKLLTGKIDRLYASNIRHKHNMQNMSQTIRNNNKLLVKSNVKVNQMNRKVDQMNSNLQQICRNERGIKSDDNELIGTFSIIDITPDLDIDGNEFYAIRGQKRRVDAQKIVDYHNVQPLTVFHQLKRKLKQMVEHNENDEIDCDFAYNKMRTTADLDAAKIQLIVAKIVSHLENGF